MQLKFVEISTKGQLWGLKGSIKIKSSIMPTESALDVERSAMKETTPAVSEINEARFYFPFVRLEP
ncbi:MAG: hypothetical protein DWQ51_17095 [Microcystis wesenbergii TW10]|uniref:Uncharacterized protein n=1 Tax=Microcystis wesenbergii TW10 TaxID=2060474 RepID=A0A3E0LPH6_9CHRO|nr:MAG: hypothetical protein DWQ51_17095 [Microcystis wesenbergii TW10]